MDGQQLNVGSTGLPAPPKIFIAARQPWQPWATRTPSSAVQTLCILEYQGLQSGVLVRGVKGFQHGPDSTGPGVAPSDRKVTATMVEIYGDFRMFFEQP